MNQRRFWLLLLGALAVLNAALFVSQRQWWNLGGVVADAVVFCVWWLG